MSTGLIDWRNISTLNHVARENWNSESEHLLWILCRRVRHFGSSHRLRDHSTVWTSQYNHRVGDVASSIIIVKL